MIIQWAAANAPDAVEKIEAHRSTVAANVLAAVGAGGRARAQIEVGAHVVGKPRAHLGRGHWLLHWPAAFAHPFAELRLVLLVLLVLRRRGVVETGGHPRRVGSAAAFAAAGSSAAAFLEVLDLRLLVGDVAVFGRSLLIGGAVGRGALSEGFGGGAVVRGGCCQGAGRLRSGLRVHADVGSHVVVVPKPVRAYEGLGRP
jgi:hypothetical protein